MRMKSSVSRTLRSEDNHSFGKSQHKLVAIITTAFVPQILMLFFILSEYPVSTRVN